MSSRTLTVATALTVALAGTAALGQSERPDENALFGGGDEKPAQADTPTASPSPDRPSEDALFGEDPAPSANADASNTGDAVERQPSLTEAPPEPGDRDGTALSGPGTRSAFDSNEAVDDPLQIGGQFYLRGFAAATEGTSFGNTSFAAPTLVDGYFDARPMERLRGFVVGRLSYDPTVPTATDANAPSNPRVLLDQAWLRFDFDRTVFFTVGKQHVKWGSAQIWNPTDFLSPQRRNPLAFVDLRTGVSMVKVHVPWEAKGWNFYGIAVIDDLGTDTGALVDNNTGGLPTEPTEPTAPTQPPPEAVERPVNRLSRIGGALRAEVVMGPAELAVSVVAQRGRKPRFGFDLSSAVGPIDVYGELGLKKGTDQPLYRLPAGATVEDIIKGDATVEEYHPSGLTPQVTAGANYSFGYGDNDLAVLGVEYFYNSTGYTSSLGYPFLMRQNAFQPLYIGQHYTSAYLFLNDPGPLERTSFNLFTLGNLSDKSYISRLNVTHRALSYLTLEAYGAVHYGHKGGEFRMGFTVPELVVDGRTIPGYTIPTPTFELGVGLRISL
ncbi:hypothetical protein MYSTI_02817 [Myxococcus stipitatus DSM 14675]|uniref:Uncharacterized protein n=1 Tax=Myxococcus stipitatus (strain DSM 14675 / JCM 12634 / Mx s8) TaxID=1278073 RepID=L7U7P7_MYXSD|nr:hypothetical protein [Myxococcus stipitatus]AGC44133.1 hypothetical protein MYSTI_02817 [Myxococcus stipitatus DSM 14675]